MTRNKYWFARSAHGRVWLGLVVLLMTPATLSAATYTWSGGAFPDPDMTNGANWVGGFAPDFFDYLLGLDSIVFTGSVNTSPVVPEEQFLSPPRIGGITFDAAADAFTIGPADADHYLYLGTDGDTTDRPIVNNSTATQTLGAMAMYAGTVNAASGSLAFNHAFNVGGGDWESGYNVTLVGDNDITFAGGLTGAGTSITAGGFLYVDMREQQPDTSYTYGRAYITADSMIPNDLEPTPWQGKVYVRQGALRISSNLALGDPSSETQITDTGTLELAGNITVPETIRFFGKGGTEPIINNVGGNNTMTGTFIGATGGGNYFFRSDAGKVTIESDLLCPGTGTRRFYLYGAGEGEFKGNVGDNGSRVWTYFYKYDSGKWTLSGINTYTATTFIYDGTLALAGEGTINQTGGIRANIATSVFDVSGLSAGKYTLGVEKVQWLDGKGTVKGNVDVLGGSYIRAGVNGIGLLTFDGDLTLQSGAFNNWQIGNALLDDSTGVGGVDFDQILVKGGDLCLMEGSELRVYVGLLAAALRPGADPQDPFWSSTHTWKVIDVDEANGGTNLGGTNFSIVTPMDNTFPGLTLSTFVGTTAGVDLGDIFLKCTSSSQIPGDANGDNQVDEADAKRLATYWGATSEQGGLTMWQMGDFNNDNTIDARDAAILAAQWGYNVGGETNPAAVPEPSALVLLLASASMLLALRRRRP
ncbi:MAG: PEP-CTERM sorting domain-containing protein [Pirellulaceae bacterium]|nr:PEP-CTERM sorting domain-containing protein [Pirellulaceae bacterium]